MWLWAEVAHFPECNADGHEDDDKKEESPEEQCAALCGLVDPEDFEVCKNDSWQAFFRILPESQTEGPEQISLSASAAILAQAKQAQ